MTLISVSTQRFLRITIFKYKKKQIVLLDVKAQTIRLFLFILFSDASDSSYQSR